MDSGNSSAPDPFIIAITAILVIAVVAFVAITVLIDSQQDVDSNPILPTLPPSIIPGSKDSSFPSLANSGRATLPAVSPGGVELASHARPALVN